MAVNVDFIVKEKAREILRELGIHADQDIAYDTFDKHDPTDPDQEICIDLQRQAPYIAALILVRDVIGKRLHAGYFQKHTPGWVYFWKSFREFVFGALNAVFSDIAISSLKEREGRLVACGQTLENAPWAKALKFILVGDPGGGREVEIRAEKSEPALSEFVKVAKF